MKHCALDTFLCNNYSAVIKCLIVASPGFVKVRINVCAPLGLCCFVYTVTVKLTFIYLFMHLLILFLHFLSFSVLFLFCFLSSALCTYVHDFHAVCKYVFLYTYVCTGLL